MRGLLVLLVLLVLLAAALVAAALALPHLVDEPALRGRLLAMAERTTGYPLKVHGAVRLGLLPVPRLSVDHIAIGAPETGRLVADRADVDLALVPLLAGRLEPARLRLVRPHLVVPAVPGDPWHAALDGIGRHGATALIEVVDGSIELLAPPSPGWPMRLDGLGLRLAWNEQAHSFALQGTGAIGEEPLRLDLALQPVPATGQMSLRLQASSTAPAAPLTVSFQGAATAEGTLAGRLRVAVPQGRAPDWLAVPAGLASLPPPPGALELAGQLTAGPARIELGDLVLTLAGNELRGRWAMERGPQPRAELSLEGTRAELGPELERTLRMAAQMPAATLAGRAELRLASLSWRGDELRKVRIEAELDQDGRWRLPRLEAVLPGEAALRWTGRAAAGPGLAGALSLQAGELRPLLRWLGVAVEDLPPAGLTSLDLTTEVELVGERAELRSLDARLDATTLVGSARWQGGARPGLVLVLNADRLNTALYRVDWDALDLTTWRRRLQALDLDLTLGIDRLSHDRWRGGRLSLRAATREGGLDLGELLLVGQGGDRLKAEGRAELGGDAYRLAAELDLTPESLALLAALPGGVGLPGEVGLGGLGTLTLHGSLQGDRDAAGIKASLEGRGLSASLKGSMAGPLDWSVLDLAGEARLARPAELLAALGWVVADERPLAGGVGGEFTLRRNGGTFDAKLTGRLGASDVSGHAVLSRGVRPLVDVELVAGTVDLALLRLLYDLAAPRLSFPAGDPWHWPGAWPGQRLSWDWLGGPDLMLDLNLAALRQDGATLPGARLAASLRDDRLTLERLELPLAGGELQGTVTLDRGAGHAMLGADLTLIHARAEQLAPLVAAGSGLAGELDLSGRLAASGLAVADLVGSLTGEGALSLRRGRLGGIVFPPRTGAEAALDPGVEVTALQGPLRLERGVAASEPPGLALSFPGGAATAELRLDLLAWLAELRLEGIGDTTDRGSVPVLALIGPPGRLRAIDPPEPAAP
ncbi:MAG: AsmA family protein [Geminicoccaceae bacterium]